MCQMSPVLFTLGYEASSIIPRLPLTKELRNPKAIYKLYQSKGSRKLDETIIPKQDQPQ